MTPMEQDKELGNYSFYTEKEIWKQIHLVQRVSKNDSRIHPREGVHLSGLNDLRSSLQGID